MSHGILWSLKCCLRLASSPYWRDCWSVDLAQRKADSRMVLAVVLVLVLVPLVRARKDEEEDVDVALGRQTHW